MRVASAALFLLLSAAVPPSGAESPPSPVRSTEAGVGERLARIERIMWERDQGAVRALRDFARNDPDEKVRERAVGALVLLEDRGDPQLFFDRLSSDRSARVRRAAADAIGELTLRPDRIELLLDPLRKDTDPLVRAESARALGRLEIAQAAGYLIFSVVSDASPEVRALAVEALSRLHGSEAQGALSNAAQRDPSALVRMHAVRALAGIHPASSIPLFRSIWKEAEEPELRIEAYRGLLRASEGMNDVEEGLRDRDPAVRVLALRSWIARIRAPRDGSRIPRNSADVLRLEGYLKDPVRGIREYSRRALETLGFKVRPDGSAYTIDDR